MAALPPPFLNLENISNLRPLPAIPLPTPLTFRPNRIFRSADPYRASPYALRDLSIAVLYDLRSVPEIQNAEGGLGWAKENEGRGNVEGIRREWVPIFEEQDYSPERLARRFMKYMAEGEDGVPQAYLELLQAAGPAYARIFRGIIAAAPSGVLVHCTAGKDRTGLFVAILLSFLGASDETIADEYNLTEIGLAHMKAVSMGRILDGVKRNNAPLVEAMGEDEVKKGVERAVGAARISMLWTLEMLRAEFGGPERYLREKCGLSGEELAKLRDILVVSGEERAALL